VRCVLRWKGETAGGKKVDKFYSFVLLTSTILRKLCFILFTLLIISDYSAFAQKHTVKIRTDIPLQYAIGYDFQIDQKLSSGTKIWLFTTPYNNI